MLQAFFESTALFELPGRGRILASGEDRKRLLHAMTTNHVQQLEPGQGGYAFFLNAQGRILSDVHVLALPESLLLDVTPGRRAFAMEHLDKYIIADDVQLEDLSEQQTTLALEGPKAAEVLAAIDAPIPVNDYDIVAWAGRWIAKISYTGAPGYQIFVNTLDAPVLKETLLDAGAIEAHDDEVEAARIAHGQPLYGVDITDANLPQETQLASALHFTKGCYLGQEIVERVRSRGHVNKLLSRFRISAPEPPAAHARIMAGEKDAGVITSAAYDPRTASYAALGYLRAEHRQAALRVDGHPAQLL